MAKQVLVVDDSKIVRKVTRKMLEPMGYEVHEAEDGQQAVDFCKNNMPDVILLDYNMPVMNGMDCLQGVRALPNGGSDVVIIFCTTVNEMDFIQKAIMAGANEYVMKPFDADILQGKFEQLNITPQ